VVIPWVLDGLAYANGPDFRFDHAFARMQEGGERVNLHGGPFTVRRCVNFYSGFGKEGFIHAGRMALAVILTRQDPKTGGFGYIPGSHKSAFHMDGAEVLDKMLGNDIEDEAVVVPTLEIGDVVLFSDALVHGTTRWSGGETRVNVHFAYSPGYMAYRPFEEIAHIRELCTTDIQRRLVCPPYAASGDAEHRNAERPPTLPRSSMSRGQPADRLTNTVSEMKAAVLSRGRRLARLLRRR
jgi:hypothetical protein